MKIDIFYGTGFDVINIPCNPELLYNGEFTYETYEDVNLVQTDWLANIIIEDDRLDWVRDADYVVIEDEDKNTRSCYTIDHYEMLSEGVCKFYLLLDPINTAGGFEPVTLDGTTHEPIIVQGGSVNRISVPLTKAVNHNDFQQCEDDTFFTLEEPFQPSNRLINSSQQLTPQPYVPPTPPVVDWQNFRYPTNNTAAGTVGYTKTSRGVYQMGGSPGAPTMSKHLSAGEYQDVQILSSLPGTFDPTVFATRFQFLDSISVNMAYNWQYILNQKSNFTTDHQIFFNDLENVIMPAVAQYIVDCSVKAEETNRTDYLCYITPHYIDENGVDKYILQNGEGDAATVRLASPVTPPFTDQGIYYNVRIKIPTAGDHRISIKRDGTVVPIS